MWLPGTDEQPNMTKQAKPRSWYIKIIHIAKNKLQMDDATYRANLKELVGKESCSKMSIPELVQVLAFMKSRGFKPEASKKTKKEKQVPDQLDKLRQVWVAMAKMGVLRDRSDKALESWALPKARRINKGKGIAKLEWLPSWILERLIETLKQWHKRELLKVVPEMVTSLPATEMSDEHQGDLYLIYREVMNRLDDVGQFKLAQAYDTLKKLHLIYKERKNTPYIKEGEIQG